MGFNMTFAYKACEQHLEQTETPFDLPAWDWDQDQEGPDGQDATACVPPQTGGSGEGGVHRRKVGSGQGPEIPVGRASVGAERS